MPHIGGWTIWANDGGRLRQYSVLEPSEDGAFATFEATHPGLEIVSRQALPLDLTNKLGKGGEVFEWLPATSKDRIERALGVPVGQPIKG
jgi:hypothetical protein